MKNGGGHFAPELGGHFELELGAHFKLELGGQYHWNLHSMMQNFSKNSLMTINREALINIEVQLWRFVSKQLNMPRKVNSKMQ